MKTEGTSLSSDTFKSYSKYHHHKHQDNKDTPNTVKTQQNLLYSTTSGLHVSTP